MQPIYYLDANAIIKYSLFQEYLQQHSQQEEGVQTVRDLIRSKAGIFYCSNFALLECFHTLLKKYRDNQKCKVFGDTLDAQICSIELIFKRLRKAFEEGELHVDQTALTSELLIDAQKLTYQYGIQKQKIDSLDAIHLALVKELSKIYQQQVILITSDETMIDICRHENITVFNPAS